MPKRTLPAFYDTREDATQAMLSLWQAGIPNSDVSLSPETGVAGAADGPANECASPRRSMTPMRRTEAEMAAAGVLSTPSSVQAYRTAASQLRVPRENGRDNESQIAEGCTGGGEQASHRGNVRVHAGVAEAEKPPASQSEPR